MATRGFDSGACTLYGADCLHPFTPSGRALIRLSGWLHTTEGKQARTPHVYT